jgi:hypothetical protein
MRPQVDRHPLCSLWRVEEFTKGWERAIRAMWDTMASGGGEREISRSRGGERREEEEDGVGVGGGNELTHQIVISGSYLEREC